MPRIGLMPPRPQIRNNNQETLLPMRTDGANRQKNSSFYISTVSMCKNLYTAFLLAYIYHELQSLKNNSKETSNYISCIADKTLSTDAGYSMLTGFYPLLLICINGINTLLLPMIFIKKQENSKNMLRSICFFFEMLINIFHMGALQTISTLTCQDQIVRLGQKNITKALEATVLYSTIHTGCRTTEQAIFLVYVLTAAALPINIWGMLPYDSTTHTHASQFQPPHRNAPPQQGSDYLSLDDQTNVSRPRGS